MLSQAVWTRAHKSSTLEGRDRGSFRETNAQRFSIGFKSGLFRGQSSTLINFSVKKRRVESIVGWGQILLKNPWLAWSDAQIFKTLNVVQNLDLVLNSVQISVKKLEGSLRTIAHSPPDVHLRSAFWQARKAPFTIFFSTFSCNKNTVTVACYAKNFFISENSPSP